MTVAKIHKRARTVRTFDGKRFIWADLTRTKREAQDVALDIRKHGRLARITKLKSGHYDIWSR